jgi:glycosyltransferase involved in cell wall biosynthesis
VPEETLQTLRNSPRVHFTGPLHEGVAAVYAASDLCVLPTFREGLPQVALEAAAMELPVVGTLATGVVDAVEDGVTGLLVPVRDAQLLAAAIGRLLNDAPLRQQMGAAGRLRISEKYSSLHVNRLWMEEYCVHALVHLKGASARLGQMEAERS